MNKINPNNLTPKDRERLIIQYCAALERGDFEITQTILERAAEDAELEKMIFEIEAELLEDDGQAAIEEMLLDLGKARIRELAERHLPSGVFEADEETALSAPTVRSIFARMQEDRTLKAWVRREAAEAQSQMKIGDAQLPSNLSIPGIEKLFRAIGIKLSEPAKKFFWQTAVLLQMAREDNEIQLAATRKQRESRRRKAEKDEE